MSPSFHPLARRPTERRTSRPGITWMALLFLVGAGAGIPAGFALAQGAPRLHVEVLLRIVTSEIPRSVNLEVRHDRWDPGAETGLHQHPGPVILAVLEGELIEDTAAGRTILSTGQVVWRAARQEHNVINESGKLARILAIHFDPTP